MRHKEKQPGLMTEQDLEAMLDDPNIGSKARDAIQALLAHTLTQVEREHVEPMEGGER